MNLYIYGSGGNGCELCDIAERINHRENRWENISFVDDIRVESTWYDRRVYRFDEMLVDEHDYECVISLGEPAHRKELHEKLRKNSVSMATLIDPSVNISPTASIGSGSIIGPGSFVSSNTSIDINVMLEVHTILGHDIHIGMHTVISSCSVIGGNTHIGDESFVGLNCSIKEKITIGNRCIIGMGSSVFKDIENEYIVLGNPARPIRKNEQNRVFKT